MVGYAAMTKGLHLIYNSAIAQLVVYGQCISKTVYAGTT